MSEAVVGLVGVVAGAFLTGGVAWWADRERRKRELFVAAARCLDRLKKIQLLAPWAQPAEIHLLGESMDAYLTAIGAAPGKRLFRAHWGLYEKLQPLLIRPSELDGLQSAIAALELELTK